MSHQKAKKKPLVKKTPAELGVDLKPRHEVLSTEEPAVRQAGQKVASTEELLARLKEKGVL